MTVAFRIDRPVEHIDLAVAAPLELEADRRAAVEAHFAGLAEKNPALWNGPFYLFDDIALDGATFRATARATDYATFLLWRSEGFPGPHHTHIFPVPAVTTADGRLLVGVMGRQTTNAGLAYPPSGSFDPGDLVDGRLDPVANMLRELEEEAGVVAATLTASPGFTVLDSGSRRIALVKRWRSALTSTELAREIAAHIGRESDPELGGFDFLPFDRRLDERMTVPYVNTLLGLLEAEDRAG